MNKTLKSVLVGALAVFAASATALANPVNLTPGGSAFTPDSGVQNTWGTGTILGSHSSSFNTATIEGTVYSWVESGVASNPYGGLTFFYSVSNEGIAPDHAITGFTVDGWTSFLTDVAYDDFWGSAQPNFSARSADGDVVGFYFNSFLQGPGALALGATSHDLIIYTNATSFKLVNGGVLNGTAGSVSVFGANVPDGGMTALMLGLGLLALGLASRRHKQA